MGLIKQMQLEQDEKEYKERMKALEAEAKYFGFDDPEVYEAWLWTMEKDD